MDLTEEQCVRSATWAVDQAAQKPYKPNDWNATQFLIAEHCQGLCSAGATVYKCRVGFNIDFDMRCDRCGNITALGSVDVVGPVHSEIPDGGVVIGNSIVVTAAAIGVSVNVPKPKTPEEAGKHIWSILSRSPGCDCTED